MTLLQGSSVAVVGGGLAGMGVAYHAARTHNCVVSVFSSSGKEVGAASHLASLMHPHTPRGKLIWKGIDGVHASLELLSFAEGFSAGGESVFYRNSSAVRRVCLTPEHVDTFTKAATLLPEYVAYTQSAPGEHGLGFAEYKKSFLVNTPRYLDCLRRGLVLSSDVRVLDQKLAAADVSHLSTCFDLVVVCAGAGIVDLWDAQPSKLTLVRGQNVRYSQPPSSERRLAHGLICGEYVVPASDGTLICGATHEHSLASLHAPPDLASATALLSEHVCRLYPPLSVCTPLSASSGVRVLPPRTHLGKVPLVGRHPTLSNVWMLTGLGSHGLVHHAVMAKMLLASLFSVDGETVALPEEVLYRSM